MPPTNPTPGRGWGARSAMSLYGAKPAYQPSASNRAAAPRPQPSPFEADEDFDMERPACPKCGQPAKRSRKLYRDLGLSGMEVLIARCPDCNLFAAAVPGIQNVWREDVPGVMEQLVKDAHDGDRQRRFLTDDAWGPAWTVM